MYASNGGYLDLVMLLLSTPSTKAPSHFNINEQNREGATALYLACREGQVSVVEVLITNGADVNQATKTGRSPLHVSVMNKHRAVIKTLLSKGADIHARDKLKGQCRSSHPASQLVDSHLTHLDCSSLFVPINASP